MGETAIKPVMNRRRAARFAAIQALYQIELAGEHAETVVGEFTRHRLQVLLEPFTPDNRQPPVDIAWFRLVVLGAWAARADLDAMLERCLAEGWTLARCGYFLRATLRAGAFELAQRADVPLAVVISEYVEVAKLFLDGTEPGFVHAVLDRAAPLLRARDAAL